jgi:hypothetical protein
MSERRWHLQARLLSAGSQSGAWRRCCAP